VPAPPAIDQPVRSRHTTGPARYGFHGTLHPPVALAPGVDAGGFGAEVAGVARRHRPLRVGLSWAWFGPWLVLAPEPQPPALGDLADDLVTTLHPLRRPPTGEEQARRRAAGLTARQELHLERWGYPYVFDEFRFHLTVAGPVPEPERPAVEALARWWFEGWGCLEVADVAVVAEPAPGQPFVTAGRFPLAT
jgi:hypothetical protein